MNNEIEPKDGVSLIFQDLGGTQVQKHGTVADMAGFDSDENSSLRTFKGKKMSLKQYS